MRVISQIIQCLGPAGDKTAECAKRLRESSVDKRYPFFHSEMFSRAAPICSAAKHGVRFINKNTRVVRLGHVEQTVQAGKISIHGINAFDDYELPFSFSPAERSVERSRIVVLETIYPRARENRAVAQTQVRSIVENRNISLA